MAKYNNKLEDKLDLTPASINVLKGRYLKKNSHGEVIETANQMFKRVAKNIAKADIIYDPNSNLRKTDNQFYNLMAQGYFLPNSPTLMNAGRELQQLSGCFVLPVEDSIESIFESAKQGALVHKSGGGTGYSFSRIRPKKDQVKSTDGVASGPVSFMEVYNAYTNVIKQGGKRRGANMGVLRIDHPDILEFIDSKALPDEKATIIKEEFKSIPLIEKMVGKKLVENYQLNNFNISVAITDEFMKALEEKREYSLIHPTSGEVTGTLNAEEVMEKIAQNAWQGGEPGIIFIDTMNKYNPTPHIGEIEATNPCGEQPLLPNESCNLGSINLSKFVVNENIDYSKLEEIIHTSVHFLDNVIDMNKYPLSQIEEMTKSNRKIGLGIMGFANALAKMKITYGSKESFKIAEEIMEFIDKNSKNASIELAKTRGVFPNWKGSIYDPKSPYKGEGLKLRNATTTTVAPTGTISVIAGTSSGIEPLFGLAYERKTPQFDLYETNKVFEEELKKRGIYSEELLKKILENEGSIQDMEEIPEDLKKIFVIANEISPEQHVEMQARFQKHTDSSISKTINFGGERVEVKDIIDTYLLAYRKGCKGLTIYREGSRDSQVLNVGSKDNEKKSLLTKIVEEALDMPRPKLVAGPAAKVPTPFNYNAFINLNFGINPDTKEYESPYECFASVGNAGGDLSADADAMARLISLCLRSGVPVERVIEQLTGIRGSTQKGFGEEAVGSLADAIAKGLIQTLKQIEKLTGEKNGNKIKKRKFSGDRCISCGSMLVFENGCNHCPGCGDYKC